MTTDHASCPSPENLELIAAGHDPDPSIAAHVARCARCADRIADARFAQRFERVMTGRNDNGPRHDAAVPEIFGYHVHQEIARGGQGVVFEATQGTTGRRVAVKVLHPELSGKSRRARERMAREIQIVGSLDHPGIVRVFDSVKLYDGRDALVMELIEGEPLGLWLQRRADLDERSRLELLARVADATHHAHQHGVIHRDLKPSNILVDRDGQPHLLDFGVARRTGLDGVDPKITHTGEFAGTLAYAAPEQVSEGSGDPDIRTDVYAIGTIGFEILTGTPPISAEGSLHDVIDRILTHDPPTRAGSGISHDAWTVLAKATSKDKARRYQSAADMARDLSSAARGEAVHARADSRWYTLRKSAERHRAGLTIATLALAGLAGVLVSLAIGNTRLSNALQESRLLQIRAQLAVGSREQAERVLWKEIDRDLRPGIEPERALWSGSPRERALLWCFIEMQAPATCLEAVPEAFIPTIGVSALNDRTILAARTDRTLVRLDPSSPRTPIPTGARISEEAITIKVGQQGHVIVCVGEDRLWTIDPRTSRTIATFPLDAQNARTRGLVVTDWGLATNDASGLLRVLDLPGLEPVFIAEGIPSPQTPWLDPDHRTVAFITQDARLRFVDIDTNTDRAPSGLAIVGRKRLGPNPQLLVSPDRTRYAVAYGGGMIVRAVSQSTDSEPLLNHPGYRVWVSNDPAWSLIAAAANGDPTLHLWETESWKPLDGLSGHQGSVISHAFLPDASRIVTLDAAGTLRVWATPEHAWRHTLGPETSMAHQIAADERAGAVYATDNNGTLHRYTRTDPPTRFRNDCVAVRAAIDQSATYAATCDLTGQIELFDNNPDTPPRTLRIDRVESIAGLRFSPGAAPPRLAVAVNPAAVMLIDPRTLTVERTIMMPTSAAIADVAWASNGHAFAVALRDGTIVCIDNAQAPDPRPISVADRQIRSLEFTPDSRAIAAVGDDGVLHIVDAQTTRERTSKRLSEHSLFCVTVHPQGRVAMIGDRAGVVKAVDLDTMTELASFNARGSVMSMQFIDDGQALAVAALDRPIEIWSLTDLVRTLPAIRTSNTH